MDDLSSRRGAEWNDPEVCLDEAASRRSRPGPSVEEAARFAAALESTADTIVLVDAGWRIAFINRQAKLCFGDDRRAAVGGLFWDFWPRKGSAPSRQMLIRSLEQQASRTFEDYFPELDAWYEIHADPWEGGLAVHLRDVTARHHAFADLAASEARYRAIVESAADAIVSAGDDGLVDGFNRAAEAMFGYRRADIIGRSVSLVLPAFDPEWADAEPRPGIPARRVEGWRRDGSAIRLDLSQAVSQRGKRRFLTLIARECGASDLSAGGDSRLRHLSRLALLGTLAAGIVHDFNNMLLVIDNMAALAREEAGGAARAHLDMLREAVRRAEGLACQALALARQDPPRRERVRLGDAVNAALDLLRASVPRKIAIRRRFEGAVAEVVADPTQLHQLVLNLGINAANALAPRGGTITVELTAPASAPAEAGVPAAGFARLAIRDDGAGMTPEVLARAFDPFFTTRTADAGTGLGLAIVRDIAVAHGGAVSADSTPGIGTTVTVSLPLASGCNG